MITVDAMKKSAATDQIPLAWVGMEKITLPIQWDNEGVKTTASCEFDVFVDLVSPSKGIHMSRLYELLAEYVSSEMVSMAGVRQLLSRLVQSQNGLSRTAQVVMSFSMPIRMSTLKSERTYFKMIPLRLKFFLDKTELNFHLEYSSTCPQSAALAHQLTIQELEAQNQPHGPALLQWYAQRGMIATPHAQRSELELNVVVDEPFELNQFADLFIQLGQCLGTPTQGLVKRQDEQEFARLNALNLMFCEDAARKLTLFLKRSSLLKSGWGKVRHLESLHSHNAVACFQF
ncbi:MAG: GTP cyclohydrolase I FolE2 [Bdellovibrionaceae bacterium]|nr:GTP cyclohydrolase I FolE2 [Pseudobdellovibrionaceae bacterium]